MRRMLIPGLVLAGAAALLALLAFGVSNQGTNRSIEGSLARGVRPPAPNAAVALPVLGSSARKSLSSLRGKVVVLNVFASWCVPCRTEAPILDREQKILTRHNGTILGVTYLDDSSDSETFVRHERITYPVLRDVSGSFLHGFGTDGVPETFIIDRQGRVAAVRRYQLAGDWLQTNVERVLAQST